MISFLRKRKLCLCSISLCVSQFGLHDYIIAEISPGKLDSSGHLHLLIHTHLDMLYLKIGKSKCIHRPHKKRKWEMPSPFIILSEKIVQAASSARKANEWKGEQSANNVPWLQIKVSVLLLSLWAAEMLLWVLIRKRKIFKEMWAACLGYIFISQPCLVKPEAEVMLAGVAGQAEALGKIRRQMNWCFRGSLLKLPSSPPHAQLSSVYEQGRGPPCTEPATPASSQYHKELISPSNQAVPLTLSLTFTASESKEVGKTP